MIDPGADADGAKVLAELEKHGLTCAAILLTRGHVEYVPRASSSRALFSKQVSYGTHARVCTRAIVHTPTVVLLQRCIVPRTIHACTRAPCTSLMRPQLRLAHSILRSSLRSTDYPTHSSLRLLFASLFARSPSRSVALAYPAVRAGNNRLMDTYVHPADQVLLRKWREQCNDFGLPLLDGGVHALPRPDKDLADGQVVAAGAHVECTCIHTPGHSPGGTCFFFEELGFVVTGATLMQRAVGRTNWAGVASLDGTSDPNQLLESIEARLMTLPPETQVIPGHGPLTTLHAERRTNPFLRGLRQRWTAFDRCLEERHADRMKKNVKDDLPF